MKSFCTGSMELKLDKELYPHRHSFMKIVQASRTQKNSGGGYGSQTKWGRVYFPL